MVYVVFNLYAKKQRRGAVGYITVEIPSVLEYKFLTKQTPPGLLVD